jgi:hypothetical protein
LVLDGDLIMWGFYLLWCEIFGGIFLPAGFACCLCSLCGARN